MKPGLTRIGFLFVMTDPRNISILDYTYELPNERIALHPLAERDASKLLIYRNGIIGEDIYRNIAGHIPANSLLVFNNSKVINARLRFTKSSGGVIEIFCLEPHETIKEYSSVMNQRGSATWKCFVGGVSKWKEKELVKQLRIGDVSVTIKACLVEKLLTDAYIIQFSWEPAQYSFAEVIEAAGDIPLPPYIKREADKDDAGRYQTIYAKHDGSVAAPTAGLHFTDNVFIELSEKNIQKSYVTLHVGAGTFKPVKAQVMNDHEMHAEWIDVDIETIRRIREKKDHIIAVGTTSLRTIETLYWLGIKTILQPGNENLALGQWDVYEPGILQPDFTVEESLHSLERWLERKKLDRLFTRTKLLITPGYRFRIAKAIITNFHQPQSTLLLLVAAAVGDDWKKIYRYALKNEFRFLSYGDGNLLFIDQG